MAGQEINFINKINLKPNKIDQVSEFISYERQAAIHDLINENSFLVKEKSINGPYNLNIEINNNVLLINITNEELTFSTDFRIPINSLRRIVKIYDASCKLYFNSIKEGSIEKIEEIEKNRRKIHNEGADKFIEITKNKFEMDHNTARRMFTLLYTLYI